MEVFEKELSPIVSVLEGVFNELALKPDADIAREGLKSLGKILHPLTKQDIDELQANVPSKPQLINQAIATYNQWVTETFCSAIQVNLPPEIASGKALYDLFVDHEGILLTVVKAKAQEILAGGEK